MSLGVTLDADVRCAYIALNGERRPVRQWGHSFPNVELMFDVDENGNLLGIEVIM